MNGYGCSGIDHFKRFLKPFFIQDIYIVSISQPILLVGSILLFDIIDEALVQHSKNMNEIRLQMVDMQKEHFITAKFFLSVFRHLFRKFE